MYRYTAPKCYPDQDEKTGRNRKVGRQEGHKHRYGEPKRFHLPGRAELLQWSRGAGDEESQDKEPVSMQVGREQAGKQHRKWYLEVNQVKGEMNPTSCMTQKVVESPDSHRRWKY